MDKVKGRGITSSFVQGIGITNQRETSILWDKTTGKCFYNNIVWCDDRTQDLADMLVSQTPTKNKDYYRPLCGLPIHPYFSALKIKWIMDNVPEVQIAMAEGRCLFGTVDTWIIWNLTGGSKGGIHVTDITNASCTMLMDLQSHQWDPELCRFFGIPMSILPQIRSCSEVYGTVADGSLKGVPISGCLGDQQADLIGQRCFQKGDAKNTYGYGCFLVYNTGTQRVNSNHGLLTTVAYKLGPNEPVYYALEGSVPIAGECVRWLTSDLLSISNGIIEELACKVEDTADLYFVPAFSGLYAPHWEHDARGIIIGLSNFTNKSHICRATLEAICFQSREILEAMNQDSELPLASLKVDGGMTDINLLLQLQADILGIPVECPVMTETATVLGAALAAGKGVGLWKDLNLVLNTSSDNFYPSNSHDDRELRYSRWKEAVERCKHWHKAEENETTPMKYIGKVYPIEEIEYKLQETEAQLQAALQRVMELIMKMRCLSWKC